MVGTLVQKLGKFAHGTSFEELPEEVIEESKRVILDTLGCALGGVHGAKGRAGIELGRLTGGITGDTTIIGTPYRSSVIGAAYANGELINDLDFDSVLPPGHVSPYVMPGIFAIGEQRRAPGTEIIRSTAVAHELSFAIGTAMDLTRDQPPPPVVGYSSTIFGAAAAASMLLNASPDEMSHSLAIAAAVSPVNAHRAWMTQVPAATVKYLVAGVLSQSALDAAYMAHLGHRGALQILDDDALGYRAFIGTRRWEPDKIECAVGTWSWVAQSAFKPYPHCRILHAPLQAVIEIVSEHDLAPEEIDAIRVLGEAWVMQGVWINRNIDTVADAQMSIANGIAVGAHRVKPGPAWQDPEIYKSESVMRLMDRVTYQPHPDFFEAIAKNPSARPSRVELDAKGQTFVVEKEYPPGVRSHEPSTFMTDDELIAKFHVNAENVIRRDCAERAVETIMSLETVEDFSEIMNLLARVEDKAG